MKTASIFMAMLLFPNVALQATVATVNLDNFYSTDPNGVPQAPIYYWSPGTRAPDDVWVQVFWYQGSDWWSPSEPLNEKPAKAIMMDFNGDGQDDGYCFQAGIGVFPYLPGGVDVFLQVRVWSGGDTWDNAWVADASPIWRQATGSWDNVSKPLIVPPDVPLLIPGPLAMVRIPEPASWSMTILGLLFLLWKKAK